MPIIPSSDKGIELRRCDCGLIPKLVSEKHYKEMQTRYQVECKCGITSADFYSQKTCVDDWNTRAPITQTSREDKSAEDLWELLDQAQSVQMSLEKELAQLKRENEEYKQNIIDLYRKLNMAWSDHATEVHKVYDLQDKLSIAEEALERVKGIDKT